MADQSIDPNDISNGFYPHLRKVGPTNPEFLDVIAWLKSKGAPPNTDLKAERSMTVDGPGRWMPAQISWSMADGSMRPLGLDAAMMFNFPHVALTDLQQYFGFGNPNVLTFYPGLRQPVSFITVSPIGTAWPEQGANCFRPADSDRSDYGAEFIDQTGRYRKEQRSWMFVSYGVWVKQ